MEEKQVPAVDEQDIADVHEEAEPGTGEEKTATSRASRDPAPIPFDEGANVPFDDATLRGERRKRKRGEQDAGRRVRSVACDFSAAIVCLGRIWLSSGRPHCAVLVLSDTRTCLV